MSDSTVRLVTGQVPWEALEQKHRNKYLLRRDEDLTEIETLLRQARDLVDEALIGLAMYTTPQHRNIQLELGQLIEQVIEYKRVSG